MADPVPMRRFASRAVLGWLAIVVAVAAPWALATAASSDTPNPPAGLMTQVSSASQTNVAPNGPLTGLADGNTLSVSVNASGASAGKLFATDARLCKPGLNIASSAQFSPTTGGGCVNAPLSANSDDFVSASVGSTPNLVTVLFRVGTGTQTYSFFGTPTTITCDATHMCALWLKEQVDTALVTSGMVWIHFDLCFAATCPGSTTTTTLPGATTTTVPATTTTVSGTTTTTAPGTTTTVSATTTTTVPSSTSSTTTSTTVGLSTTTSSTTKDPPASNVPASNVPASNVPASNVPASNVAGATPASAGGVLGVTGLDARHLLVSGLGLVVAGALLLRVGFRRRQQGR